MKVTIGLTHSADYVRSLRLDEGDNVPAVTDFAVLISDLSTEARSALLDCGDGRYPSHLARVCYDCGGSIVKETMIPYGCFYVELDNWRPTVEQVDHAFVAAHAAAASRCAAIHQEKRELNERKAEQHRIMQQRQKLNDMLLLLSLHSPGSVKPDDNRVDAAVAAASALLDALPELDLA
jgi:hypothetical protein